MFKHTNAPAAPDALLLVAPGCAHCPRVLEGLSKLLKQGSLGRLEVVNIAAHPEIAEKVGTRSVPWTRIGPFELEGSQSPAELADWVEHARSGTGITGYLSHLLESNRLGQVIAQVRENTNLLPDLVTLLASLDTPMAARIGAGAALEDLAEDRLLNEIIPELGALTHSDEPQIRADACHYLGLTENALAIPFIMERLEDPDAEVREIAMESLPMVTPQAPS